MMDFLCRLRCGGRLNKCAFFKGIMKEQCSPSSFSLLRHGSDADTNLEEFLFSCRRQSRGVDEQQQLMLRRIEGICARPGEEGGVEVPPGHDLTYLDLCVDACQDCFQCLD